MTMAISNRVLVSIVCQVYSGHRMLLAKEVSCKRLLGAPSSETCTPWYLSGSDCRQLPGSHLYLMWFPLTWELSWNFMPTSDLPALTEQSENITAVWCPPIRGGWEREFMHYMNIMSISCLLWRDQACCNKLYCKLVLFMGCSFGCYSNEMQFTRTFCGPLKWAAGLSAPPGDFLCYWQPQALKATTMTEPDIWTWCSRLQHKRAPGTGGIVRASFEHPVSSKMNSKSFILTFQARKVYFSRDVHFFLNLKNLWFLLIWNHVHNAVVPKLLQGS